MRLRWAAASSLRQSYEKSLERTPRSRRTKSRKQNGWSLRDIRGERDFWAVLSQLLVVMRAHVGFRSMHDKLRSQYRYISIQVFMKIGHENQHVRFANSFTKCDVDFTCWTHRYAFSRLLEKNLLSHWQGNSSSVSTGLVAKGANEQMTWITSKLWEACSRQCRRRFFANKYSLDISWLPDLYSFSPPRPENFNQCVQLRWYFARRCINFPDTNF